VGGHSRGAAIASRFAYLYGDQFDGLILIGTSHPKEKAFDLSDTTLAVTKIYASNDGLASVEEVKANAIYLPDDTNWVLIDGGNHAQFGYYGAQLGDNAATISREQQQELTVEAVLAALNSVQIK
jgi:pimeloyl-ACP methyl ester carboxylesterase